MGSLGRSSTRNFDLTHSENLPCLMPFLAVQSLGPDSTYRDFPSKHPAAFWRETRDQPLDVSRTGRVSRKKKRPTTPHSIEGHVKRLRSSTATHIRESANAGNAPETTAANPTAPQANDSWFRINSIPGSCAAGAYMEPTAVHSMRENSHYLQPWRSPKSSARQPVHREEISAQKTSLKPIWPVELSALAPVRAWMR